MTRLRLNYFDRRHLIAEKLSAPLGRLRILANRLNHRGFNAESKVISRYVDVLNLQKDFVTTNRYEYRHRELMNIFNNNPSTMRLRKEVIAVLGKQHRGELDAK